MVTVLLAACNGERYLAELLTSLQSQTLSGFQVLNGLPETGQLDKITWKNLSKQFTLHAHHKAAPHIDRG
jgi:hypothetical protein